MPRMTQISIWTTENLLQKRYKKNAAVSWLERGHELYSFTARASWSIEIDEAEIPKDKKSAKLWIHRCWYSFRDFHSLLSLRFSTGVGIELAITVFRGGYLDVAAMAEMGETTEERWYSTGTVKSDVRLICSRDLLKIGREPLQLKWLQLYLPTSVTRNTRCNGFRPHSRTQPN